MEKLSMAKFYQSELTEGDKKDNYGEFILEPLNRGFGNTIGNAIRRTLISSVVGASVYAVKIKGIVHEFSAIKNVNEDMVDFILNIKQLAVKFDNDIVKDDELFELKIKNSAKGEVKASEIVCPAGIEIVNKDLVIANAMEAGAIDGVLYGRIDLGFQTFKQNLSFIEKNHGDIQGMISIDSNFSPVVKVDYTSDVYQRGEEKRQEKAVIKVTTNGTVKPAEAITFASKVLMTYLEKFFELSETPIKKIELERQVEEFQTENFKSRYPIAELNLSVRSYNSLKRAGIETLADIQGKTLAELQNIKNLGRKSLEEIIKEAQKLGVKIIEDTAEYEAFIASSNEEEE